MKQRLIRDVGQANEGKAGAEPLKQVSLSLSLSRARARSLALALALLRALFDSAVTLPSVATYGMAAKLSMVDVSYINDMWCALPGLLPPFSSLFLSLSFALTLFHTHTCLSLCVSQQTALGGSA